MVLSMGPVPSHSLNAVRGRNGADSFNKRLDHGQGGRALGEDISTHSLQQYQ